MVRQLDLLTTRLRGISVLRDLNAVWAQPSRGTEVQGWRHVGYGTSMLLITGSHRTQELSAAAPCLWRTCE
jgi:hypothetical protein